MRDKVISIRFESLHCTAQYILENNVMDSIWTNLFLAWGIQSASLLSPGPSVLFLLSVASARGRSHALAASVGISGAAVVWSTATVMGLSTILAEAGYALSIMKVVGACYLFWLALKSFRSALSSDVLVVKSKHISGGLFKSASTGFAMQISNPKAIFSGSQ